MLPVLSVARAESEGKATLPPPRPVPGINAPDTQPEACVGCHVVYPDLGLDTRLSVLLDELTAGRIDPRLMAKSVASAPDGLHLLGRHPHAKEAVADIPAACLECHGRSSTEAPPFARLLHLIHLTDDARSPFMTVFQGECTYCHKPDLRTGAWSIPSGPER